MKGKLKTTLFLTGLIAITAAVLAGYILFRQQNLLKSGEEFSMSVSETILSSWDTGFFILNSSDSLKNSFKPGDVELLMKNFQRVGGLQSLGEIRGSLVDPGWFPGNSPVIARFYQDAEFSTGPAEVFTELVQDDDRWMIRNFYIQTPLLSE